MLKETKTSNLSVRFAQTAEELRSAQRLRYRVFVEELGADASDEQHLMRQEIDALDEHALHLCLFDQTLEAERPEDSVVGVYRLIDAKSAENMGGFYSQSEFNIDRILALKGSKLELGRSCMDIEYRGGMGMAMLWASLAEYIEAENIRYLFGAASYTSKHFEAIDESLSYLHHKFLAQENERAVVKPEFEYQYNSIPHDQIDTLKAMKNTPSLIKSYLRLGGKIGQGAYHDQSFNTVDLFIFMDTHSMIEKRKSMYGS